MLRFQNAQSSFKIGGVTFGGQPGERRTVLIGSIFYPRHSLVEDRVQGKVDHARSRKRIEDLEKASFDSGQPTAVMVFAETAQAMRSHLDLVADITELPLFIDSPSAEVRLEGAKAAAEMGIMDRCVYNTISAGASAEEMKALQEIKFPNAVLLGFNPASVDLKGRIYMFEGGNAIVEEGLVSLATRHGIKNLLLDVAVTASEQAAGQALRAIMVSKAKWGLPTGCAMHNAVESWPVAEAIREKEKEIYRGVDLSANIMPMMAGADFVMFGPIEAARRTLFAAAFADEIMSGAMKV
jgi:tetrahydromethanopterin S-methyltransferase subunit H